MWYYFYKFEEMKLVRRLALAGLLALAVAAALGGASAQAAPMPATSGVVIDDSRDGIQCPGAADITDLSTLVPAGNQTFTLCSGEYTGPLTITGKQNLKIVGKADKVLGQPRIIPPAGFTGDLIHIENSTNVSVSGITLDGSARDNPGVILWGQGADTSGLHVVNSSVTITGSSFLRMRPNSTFFATGILVDGAATARRAVTISNNTFFDFQDEAVSVADPSGNYVPTITKNLFITDMNAGGGVQAISLDQVLSGSVSGNVVRGNWVYSSDTRSVGIQVNGVQNLKIATNTFSNVNLGIVLFGNEGPLVKNTVSGNTITNAAQGIDLETDASLVALPALHSGNKFTGNKITAYAALPDFLGITITLSSSPGSGNIVSGNTVLGYGSGGQAILTNDPAHVTISGNKTGDPVPGK